MENLEQVCEFDARQLIHWLACHVNVDTIRSVRPQAAQAQDEKSRHDLCYQSGCVARLSISRHCMGNSLSLSKC